MYVIIWKISKQNTLLHVPSSSWEGDESSSIWQMLVTLLKAFLRVLKITSKTSCKQKFPPNLLPELHVNCIAPAAGRDESVLKFLCFARFTLQLKKNNQTNKTKLKTWERREWHAAKQAQTGHRERCWVSACQVSCMLSLKGEIRHFIKGTGVIRPSHGA